ncbi:hypothetical protein BV22DRAFT_1031799 [Leucogyrophana mollusca]|uniref:Uncharacterized protein n=1 Tax=Leucogyrophana mollusca TaxID=85980 RepID=A0ACB8BP95_9AGAM|nr:hypothetical protein BV22DRAFT_1031799 [Leucogyrophana mollusca]
MDETSLRKLSRAELQKLAKANGVKANQKSELLVQALMKIDEGKSKDNPEEIASIDVRATLPLTPKSQSAALGAAAGPSIDDSGAEGPGVPNDAVVDEPDDEGSDASSVVSQDTQLTYATQPSCSRASTPPLTEICELERAVRIMRSISSADQVYLTQIDALNDAAAQFRKHAEELRAVLRAEKGRRIRMESYFTYWRDIEPEWPREWIYGKPSNQEIPPELMMRNLTPVSGPPTIPLGQKATPGNDTRPLSPEAPNLARRLKRARIAQQVGPDGVNATGGQPKEIPDQIAGPSRALPSPQPSLRNAGLKRKSRS